MARIKKEEKIEGSKKQWRFGKYERLSKEDLLKGDSRSIISQNMTLESYLETLRLQGEDITVVEEYKDDGTSGMYDSRSEFQRAIMDIENGKINALIVCDLSRMFRNDADQKHYLEYYFREKRVRIISCNLPHLDTYQDPNRVFSMDVKFQGMSNANMPIENSFKIKDKLSARRKCGLFVGPFAPYGYQKDKENKNQLRVDAEAASVVVDIYNWFVYDNMSIRKIVEKLNGLRIANPTEYKRQQGYHYQNASGGDSALWCESTVRTMLTRQYYIGNMDQHRSQTIFTSDKKKIVRLGEEDINEKEIVNNTHEAIIDERTFELAQKLLARDRRTAPGRKHHYLFSGFLVCGDCHKAMVAKHAKNISYYYCSTYVKKSRTACTKHSIREDTLQNAVLKAIQLQVALAADMQEQVQKIKLMKQPNSASKRVEALLKANQKALAKQENVQDNLYSDWKNGDITKEQYHRLRLRTMEKIQGFTQAVNQLLSEKRNLEAKLEESRHAFDTFSSSQNFNRLDNSIIIEFIDKIYIYENNIIDIQFNFQEEYVAALINNAGNSTPHSD